MDDVLLVLEIKRRDASRSRRLFIDNGTLEKCTRRKVQDVLRKVWRYEVIAVAIVFASQDVQGPLETNTNPESEVRICAV
jgi:hypothetical protein